MANWWSLDACWIGVFLAAAAGFVAGMIWGQAKMRGRLLLVALDLEAKKDEAAVLRNRLTRLRSN